MVQKIENVFSFELCFGEQKFFIHKLLKIKRNLIIFHASQTTKNVFNCLIFIIETKHKKMNSFLSAVPY
jgi:hypothetical protein